jgi:hypothetical protein
MRWERLAGQESAKVIVDGGLSGGAHRHRGPAGGKARLVLPRHGVNTLGL